MFSMVASGMPSSKYTSLLMSPDCPLWLLSVSGLPAEMQKRGASSAACTPKPRRMFRRTCTCPCGYGGVDVGMVLNVVNIATLE